MQNFLTGELPRGVTTLKKLRELHVGFNSLKRGPEMEHLKRAMKESLPGCAVVWW